MKLLINNTEQVSPRGSDETDIILFGRSPENPTRTQRVRVKGFRPYLYAEASSVREQEDWLLGQDTIEEVSYNDFESLKGQELARIYATEPRPVPDIAELFDKSWEADVQFTNRFRVDTGLRAYVEVPEPEGDTDEVVCNWREVEPVVSPDSDATPGVDASNVG